MKQTKKTIRQLRKQLRKARRSLIFVGDVKELHNTYDDVNFQSKSIQKELERELDNLVSQKRQLKRDFEFLMIKIDAGIETLKYFSTFK